MPSRRLCREKKPERREFTIPRRRYRLRKINRWRSYLRSRLKKTMSLSRYTLSGRENLVELMARTVKVRKMKTKMTSMT